MPTLYVWLCACALSLPILQLSCETSCQTIHSLSGIVLAGHSYKQIPSRSLERCIFNCEADPACFSVNFLSKRSVCQLNNITKEWFPGHVIEIPDAVYLESVARQFNPTPSCWSGLCLNGGTCGERSSSVGEQCSCPTGYAGHICEHMCTVSSLGMEDGRITKDQISASAYVQGYEPEQGRLNRGLGWRPYNRDLNFPGLWFQVDFATKLVLFTHVATQGSSPSPSHPACFLKAYSLEFKPQVYHQWLLYAVKGVHEVIYGNRDSTSVVKRTIKEPFKAVAIRILPHEFSGCALMRLEVYGCLFN